MGKRQPLKLLLFTLLFSLSLGSCHPPLKEEAVRPEQALISAEADFPDFGDDLAFASLAEALRRNLNYLSRLDPGEKFHYGPDTYSCREVMETQTSFLEFLEKNPSSTQLSLELGKRFKVYRAAGRPGNGKVLFTGYFEPEYEASLKPGGPYRYPLYKRPEDLFKIDLSRFSERFKGETIFARISGQELIPYFSRTQIDVHKSLAGRNLEIAWLKDPLDALFLQIQGSGRLRLEDGIRISVGYQASNGRPYRSIGAYMVEKGFLSREELSMQSIRGYLSEHPEKVVEVLNQNPSYVFFRTLKNGPVGSIGVPLTPQRSLALDARLFPKGALAFISSQKPSLGKGGQIEGWIDFSRFVLVQDTGGAIRGAGRADLFWGSGTYAEMTAGHLKHEGDLFVLIKKP